MTDRLRGTLALVMLALLGPTPVLAHGFHPSVREVAHGVMHGLEVLVLGAVAIWVGRWLLRSVVRGR